jgi:hypothetical protein
MVDSSIVQFLFISTPGLASAAVAGDAWWTKPARAALRAGGAAARSVGRVAVQRWIPAALVVLISVTLGVLAYVGHTPDVSGDRVIHGAVIALLASGLALSLYWGLARVVREFVTLFAVWVLSLVPLYYYAFFAFVIVVTYTQCGPASIDCPFG